MNRRILHLAIPSIVSNITVPLLGLVDVTIVGHLGATVYIGAIAVGGLLFNILYWNFGFLRMGTSGLTSQAYGRKDKDAEIRVLVQAVSVGLFSALAMLILQYPFRGSLQLIAMRRFFAVNRDIFLRTLCLIGVTTFFTSTGARQGDVILAVNTLLMQLFTLFSYIMDGFAYAGEALSGRYVGACNLVQLKRAVKALFGWGVGLSLVFTLLYGIGGENFLGLLTNDTVVIETAGHYFYWVLAIPLAGFAAFLWDGILIGATATRFMLWAMLVASGSFFVIYYCFSGATNNHMLWLAFLVYLALRGVMQTLWSRKVFTLKYLQSLRS